MNYLSPEILIPVIIVLLVAVYLLMNRGSGKIVQPTPGKKPPTDPVFTDGPLPSDAELLKMTKAELLALARDPWGLELSDRLTKGQIVTKIRERADKKL